MSVKDALEPVEKNKVEIVDFKFIDVPGKQQHFSIPGNESDVKGHHILLKGDVFTKDVNETWWANCPRSALPLMD